MESIWEAYKAGIWVEPFLVYSIILFIVVGVTLFLAIIIIRSEKINRRKNHAVYSEIIDNMFMTVVFTNAAYEQLKLNNDFAPYIGLKYFRKQMLRAIINLHQNYEGVYAKKLEDFYFQSGLMAMSVSKLKSQNWEVVCKGIQELAEMQVTKVFPALVKISKTSNKQVTIAALKACAKLNGSKGLAHLSTYKYPIDMWTQVNIISAFKRTYAHNEHESVEVLLTSANTSIVSLGLKIIHTLELSPMIPVVMQLIDNAPNDHIRQEANDVLHYLNLNKSF